MDTNTLQIHIYLHDVVRHEVLQFRHQLGAQTIINITSTGVWHLVATVAGEAAETAAERLESARSWLMDYLGPQTTRNPRVSVLLVPAYSPALREQADA